jgi:uncharacterized membrane protein
MSKNIRRITYAAIAAAIVFVITRLIVIPIGTGGAYLNFGDIAIYITAYLLGGPIAAAAAAVGSGLADLTTGYLVYAPATFVIKGLMGLAAGSLMLKRKFWAYTLACVLGGAIMVLGYALYETAIFSFPTAVANGLLNLVQWGGGVAIALILYPVAVRIRKVTQFETLR